MQINIERR